MCIWFATSNYRTFLAQKPSKIILTISKLFFLALHFGLICGQMKVVSAGFLVAVSAAVDSAILVADSATLMAASATCEKDAKAKRISLGTRWCESFLVSVDQPQLGSWLGV